MADKKVYNQYRVTLPFEERLLEKVTQVKGKHMAEAVRKKWLFTSMKSEDTTNVGFFKYLMTNNREMLDAQEINTFMLQSPNVDEQPKYLQSRL